MVTIYLQAFYKKKKTIILYVSGIPALYYYYHIGINIIFINYCNRIQLIKNYL